MCKGGEAIREEYPVEKSIFNNPKRQTARDKTVVPGKNGEDTVIFDNNFNVVPKKWHIED
jgi:hypothetical protein